MTTLRPLRYLAVTVFMLLAACGVADKLEPLAGTDVRPLRVGVPRAEAERVLESPFRQWSSEHGVSYALYEFDEGATPNYGDAVGIAIMDVITLGLFELFYALDPEGTFQARHDRTTGRVVVAYDEAGVVLGLFDEFAVLPPDGRSTERPVVLGGARPQPRS